VSPYERAQSLADLLAGRGSLLLGLLLGLEVRRLVHRAAQVEHDQRGGRADEEGHPPAPGVHLVLGERLLQHDQHHQGEQLAHDDRDVLEAGE